MPAPALTHHLMTRSLLSSTSLPLLLSTILPQPGAEQAAFRTDLSVLLEQVGGGKESLSFMKQRMRRLAQQWATAALRLDNTLLHRWRDQKKVPVPGGGGGVWGGGVGMCVLGCVCVCVQCRMKETGTLSTESFQPAGCDRMHPGSVSVCLCMCVCV